MAQQLNNATAGIQTLRTQADQGIANDVQQANNAMQQIANINQQLASGGQDDSTTVTLEDQRDQYISQLANLMDIRVTHGSNNQITIATSTGAQLVGAKASTLSFNQTGSISPTQQWNADPTKSGLGTITLTDPSGGKTDLVATGGIQSGEIAGYLSMRDNVLVQAQSQIDQIAAQMSSALSDTTTAGTAASSGPQTGFDVSVAGVSNGNKIQVTYTDAANVQHNVTIIRVDDPAALPLSNSATSNPNDTVIGVDFSGGAAAVAAQLNTALGSTGLQFFKSIWLDTRSAQQQPVHHHRGCSVDNDHGDVPDWRNGGAAAVRRRHHTVHRERLRAPDPRPQVTPGGSRSTTRCSQIPRNSSPIKHRRRAGDTTRPNFIYNQLVNTPLVYSPAAGIGAANSPMQATLPNYISQIVSQQSIAANAATNLQSGQDVVVSALQSRFNSVSGVNIDTEMANLLTLQNSYGANARVMSTVKAMLDALLQI